MYSSYTRTYSGPTLDRATVGPGGCLDGGGGTLPPVVSQPPGLPATHPPPLLHPEVTPKQAVVERVTNCDVTASGLFEENDCQSLIEERLFHNLDTLGTKEW
ncbi:unnamed protein product [Acanthoscelides obtectus]|uniref:Uncharacterized protein n=1 Tax=Acanthoscelides obtectus TaxID=200917 RepID=A0A9P0PGJ3_ACAOB|nr:unnamed protein product [Acanthoscelides obtectus]CAK1661168.1 hypothetical protein AOBTE_LOCUS22488 [Acanthoscelides obtectus]